MSIPIKPFINRNIPRQLPRVISTNVARTNATASQICGMTAPSLIPEFIRKGADKSIDLLARGIGKLAQNKYVKGFTEWCVKKDIDYTQHLSAACANVLNGFYMYNVATSKKIEEEQKKPLMLNMFIGTVLSTAGGYALNGAIDKKLIKPFENAIKKTYDTKADDLMKGFKVAKSLMVFQLLYRFVCPVVATPIANHISNKLREKKEGDKGNLTV
ncbi:hypothetical protein IJE86_06460 [bacterium]|nr:hypothetical protein [bacterium]